MPLGLAACLCSGAKSGCEHSCQLLSRVKSWRMRQLDCFLGISAGSNVQSTWPSCRLSRLGHTAAEEAVWWLPAGSCDFKMAPCTNSLAELYLWDSATVKWYSSSPKLPQGLGVAEFCSMSGVALDSLLTFSFLKSSPFWFRTGLKRCEGINGMA